MGAGKGQQQPPGNARHDSVDQGRNPRQSEQRRRAGECQNVVSAAVSKLGIYTSDEMVLELRDDRRESTGTLGQPLEPGLPRDPGAEPRRQIIFPPAFAGFLGGEPEFAQSAPDTPLLRLVIPEN